MLRSCCIADSNATPISHLGFISLDSFPLLVACPSKSKFINKNLDTISRDEEALFNI